MQTHTLSKSEKEQTKVRGISLRESQWDWLYQQAEEREGGNLSRVVRIIVDLHREQVDREREAS